MDAWIALGLCVAWFAAAPASSLNQPRPHAAQPTPRSVVPASHQVIDAESANIPPAPLPEFSDVESLQIQFEFSKPESCTDSQVCPPAPPAELETAETSRTIRPRFQRYKAQISLTESQVFACDEPELECLPNALPLTKEQLRHLRQAIHHLAAAGMSEIAAELQARHDGAAEQLREHLQRELKIKEAELKQLSDEVEQLKADLTGNADIEIRIQHFTSDLKRLRDLSSGPDGEVQRAAQVVLSRCDAKTSAADAKQDDQIARYQVALQLLAERQHVTLEFVPALRVKNGEEAQFRRVTEQFLRPVQQPDGTIQLATQDVGVQLRLKADLLPNHEIHIHGTYEQSACDRTTAVNWNGSSIPGLNRRKVRTDGQLKSGRTMCIDGLKFSRHSRDASGVVTETETSESLLITAKIVDADADSRAEYAAFTDILKIAPLPKLQDLSATESVHSGTVAPELSDAWRRTESQRIVPLSGVPDPEPTVPLPPSPAPFHLIPSPQTSGRPLLFPTVPMRSAEESPDEPEFELPPAPIPVGEDSEDVPIA